MSHWIEHCGDKSTFLRACSHVICFRYRAQQVHQSFYTTEPKVQNHKQEENSSGYIAKSISGESKAPEGNRRNQAREGGNFRRGKNSFVFSSYFPFFSNHCLNLFGSSIRFRNFCVRSRTRTPPVVMLSMTSSSVTKLMGLSAPCC